MLPPHFPRRRLQRLMNFGALSRGFGTCCLRFTNGVATIHAKLASGCLAHLYREGVEPSGSLQQVSDHPSSFSGLCLAQGKFHFEPPSHHSVTSSARNRIEVGTSRPSALAVLRLITSSYLVGACTGRSAGFAPLRMRSTSAVLVENISSI